MTWRRAGVSVAIGIVAAAWWFEGIVAALTALFLIWLILGESCGCFRFAGEHRTRVRRSCPDCDEGL